MEDINKEKDGEFKGVEDQSNLDEDFGGARYIKKVINLSSIRLLVHLFCYYEHKFYFHSCSLH